MSLEPTPGFCPSGSKTMRLTPQRNTLDRFPAPDFRTRFEPVVRPGTPEIRADKPFTRGLNRPAEWLVQEPFWERPAGPKHTRAEQVES